MKTGCLELDSCSLIEKMWQSPCSLFLSYPLIVLKNRLYAQALKQLESEFPELLEIGRNINHSYDKMVAAEHVSYH